MLIHREPLGIGDSPVQPLLCEECEEPTTANSFIEGLGKVICPFCIEAFIANQLTEPRTL